MCHNDIETNSNGRTKDQRSHHRLFNESLK